jgi:hypothetical protein
MIQQAYIVTCDGCARHATSGGNRDAAVHMAEGDGFRGTAAGPDGYLCPICLDDARWQYRPGRRWTPTPREIER